MTKNEPVRIVIMAMAVIFVLTCYQLCLKSDNRTGFPLDDAWIHQTYARNLAMTGDWSYTGGKASAGSTSPLWTGMLAIGYLLRAQPTLWAAVLGGLGLFLTAWVAEKVWRNDTQQNQKFSLPWLGLVVITEWHLVWAALSGMETIVFVLIITFCAWLTLRISHNWLLIGVLIGLSIWVRPDGLTLFGPVLMLAFFASSDMKDKLANLFKILGGSAILILPYLVFNLVMDGMIYPNTYFAKQAEYAILQNTPFLQRWFQMFFQLQVGVGIVLLPGVILSLITFIRRRNWWGISWFLWVMGFVTLYAFRLPVTYQHARYLMPVIPLYLYLGFFGFCHSTTLMPAANFWRIIKTAWKITIVVVLISFFIMGCQAFAEDVAIIETEMVAAAKWIAQNTPEDSVIAAHDIGALGYYGEREIVDLAGLINPDVIPIIRDEEALLGYLSVRNIKYLMTFPGWYSKMVSSAEVIFCTEGVISPGAGGENMCLYRIFD